MACPSEEGNTTNQQYEHSVRLVREKCTGCTSCLKRCPTEAIRVRDGKAFIIAERCIDCGECIRTCKHHAKIAVTDPLSAIDKYKRKVALPAPALYGQFKNINNIDRLLAALLAVGFDDVYEVARGAEYISDAIRAKLRAGRGRGPVISSACPAIVRLIQVRFPTLLSNVIDLISPMDAAAIIARRRVSERYGCDPKEVGVFFITPCPAKMTAIRSPLGLRQSPVDGAISILDIYGLLATQLDADVDSGQLREAGRFGVGWASPGGEAAAAKVEDAMAVDGIQNVIQVLEQIENNKLDDLTYFEGLACVSGCHGGPLVFENSYISRIRLRRLREKLPEEAPLTGEIAFAEMHQNALIQPRDVFRLDENIVDALRKMERIEEIAATLPQLDCGSCGSPTCQTLAEDIVQGDASEMNCVYRLRDRVGELARQMVDLYDNAK